MEKRKIIKVGKAIFHKDVESIVIKGKKINNGCIIQDDGGINQEILQTLEDLVVLGLHHIKYEKPDLFYAIVKNPTTTFPIIIRKPLTQEQAYKIYGDNVYHLLPIEDVEEEEDLEDDM